MTSLGSCDVVHTDRTEHQLGVMTLCVQVLKRALPGVAWTVVEPGQGLVEKMLRKPRKWGEEEGAFRVRQKALAWGSGDSGAAR